MIKIAGCDLSKSSSGVVVETVDDDFNIVDVQYYGFADKKQNERPTIVPGNNPKNFSNDYQRYKFIADYICDWCKDCTYISVEDIATHAQGMIIDLAELEGHIKMRLFEMGKKIRLYSVKSNKKFFSGRGDADKIGMRDAFNAWTEIKPDISDLPFVDDGKSGVKPTSDIIDATALCEFLRFELKLKNGKMTLSDLTPAQREVFTTVKEVKSKKTGKKKIKTPSIIDKPFLEQ